MEVQISMSPTVGKIAEALAKAQRAMRPAVKDSKNPHFKNTYASLASCIEALMPLYENGIAVLQPPAATSADGVTVTTLLLHASGEWIRGELYMPAQKKDPQGFGSALSYARRYCLTSTVGLATDDDDAEATRVKPDVAKAQPASLETKLAQSVDSFWPGFVQKYCDLLASAKDSGELLENFSKYYEEKKRLNPPADVDATIVAAKDSKKKSLNGAAP